MTKKKMTNIFNQSRDGFNSRLLLYLKKRTGIDFRKISNIKKAVWITSSENERWIIKEFPNSDKLIQQVQLTELLWKHGFHNTYRFHPIHRNGPCYFEGRCLGIIQYIESLKHKRFYYDSAENREEALSLLCRFHSTTSKCVPQLKDKLIKFDLLKKWEKRLEKFKRNFVSLKGLSVYPHLDKYIAIGEASLQIMRGHKAYFSMGPYCILHGDLAHHNFIRQADGSLFMIDFDLASIGPKQIDILQYCNRILPEIGWSPTRLFAEGEAISQFKKDIPFLAALLYPADIFREWNYFSDYDKKKQKKYWKHLKDITFHQFEKRMVFSKWIVNQIEGDTE
ncbi:aminoglycoside phosphotransferase family protein [Siminovitchia terrae]|nr:aminoglycoside phosphotransferase family protein [Siminovitchia terrae]